MRFSLRLKFFVAFAVTAAVIIVITVTVLTSIFENDKKIYIFDLNTDIAINVSRKIGEYISTKREETLLIAGLIDREIANSGLNKQSKGLNKIIKVIFEQYDDHIAFLLSNNKQMDIQIYNKKKLHTASVDATEYIEKIKERVISLGTIAENEIHIENITTSPSLPSLMIALPYKLNSLPNPSLLITILSSEKILNRINQSSAYDTFIVDKTGHVVAHRDIEKVMAKANFSNMVIIKNLLEGKTLAGTIEFKDQKGVKYLGTYSHIENTGLGVIVQRPYEAALEALKRFRAKSLNLFIYMFVIALIASIIISRNLTRPLEALANIAREIGKGHFTSNIRINSSDEIGDLASTFNEMGLKLESREKEIIATYEKLVASEEKATCYLVGQKISSVLDLDKVFSLSVTYARELVNTRGALMFVFDEKLTAIKGIAADGIAIEEAQKFVYTYKGRNTGGEEWKRELQESESFKNSMIDTFNISSHIAFPLTLFDRFYGLLVLIDKQSGDFTRPDHNLLNLFATQCAMACENARLFQKNQFLAVRDSLTGLYNRHYFTARAKEEFLKITREKKQLAYLMLDIDYFKKVNDTYGHPIGDAVLQDIARLIEDGVRGHDIVVRVGGEEIVVMLPGTYKVDALALAERLRKRIENHAFEYGDVGCPVTISIGVSSIEDITVKQEQTHEVLLKQADDALYRAKESGRNRVVGYEKV